MALAIIQQITPQSVVIGGKIAIIGENLDSATGIYFGAAGPYFVSNNNPNSLSVFLPVLGVGVYSVVIQTAEGLSNSFDIFVTDSVANNVEICPVTYSEDDFTEAQVKLFPRGFAWLMPAGSVWRKLLAGFSVEFTRIQARACDLIKESFPLLAVETLTEWEADLGLPDKCSTNTGTDINARRSQILRKLTQRGGQSIAYFESLALSLGITVAIRELNGNEFLAGFSRAGDSIDNATSFYWVVRATDFELTEFRAGQNTAGQPLRIWGNSVLECLINELKPAHTVVIFEYVDPFLLDSINENGALITNLINENGAIVTDLINENPI
jgi:uncharacterized protein YmfQ (DUF2313 family)